MNPDKKKEEEIKKFEKQLESIDMDQNSIFKRMNERRKLLEIENSKNHKKSD